MVKRNVGKISRKKPSSSITARIFFCSFFCVSPSRQHAYVKTFHRSEIGKFLIERWILIIYCQSFGAKSYFLDFAQIVWRFASPISSHTPSPPLLSFDSICRFELPYFEVHEVMFNLTRDYSFFLFHTRA